MSDLESLLRDSRVIPAVRKLADVESAAAAPGHIVYVLTGDVGGIGRIIGTLRNARKIPFVNLDLVEGLAGNGAAVAYLAELGAAGVISTHSQVLKTAHSRGLLAIQRTFLLDSHALANARRSLERFRADAVEVLPAPVAPRALSSLREMVPDLPVIAGGLVTTLAEIDALVHAGVDAVSVSDPRLWVV